MRLVYLSLLCALLPVSDAISTSFQTGRNGYNGTKDAQINTQYADTWNSYNGGASFYWSTYLSNGKLVLLRRTYPWRGKAGRYLMMTHGKGGRPEDRVAFMEGAAARQPLARIKGWHVGCASGHAAE